MSFALAVTFAIFTATVTTTAYTPSPEACRISRRNCLNPNNPLMGTGLAPFIGAAACSYDFPLGTVLRVQNPVSVTVDGNTFQAPSELICLDRFGRAMSNRRVDIVLLLPDNPGAPELALAREWGRRSLVVEVVPPEQPWRRPQSMPVPTPSPVAPSGGTHNPRRSQRL